MSSLKINCYLFYGNQDFLVQEGIENCINSTLGGREREWVYERYDLSELMIDQGETTSQKIQDLLISCKTPPMFSDLKIIRIDHSELLKTPKGKDKNLPVSKIFETIQSFLSSPIPYLCWIFSSPVLKENDFSKPFIRLLRKKGQVRKFVAYENQNQLGWLRNRIQEKHLKMHPEAIHTLISIVGNDLNDLEQELEKLKTIINGDNEISEEMVHKVVLGHKHLSVFQMTEALAKKHLKEALEILSQQLSKAPRDHVRLFSMIIFQFRRLLLVHYLLKQKEPESTIANRISLPPYLTKQAIKQANHFTCRELELIMVKLASNDLQIKFHGDKSHMMLENLFQQICSHSFTK